MDYHNDRFNDFSLMIFKENTLIALLPANFEAETVYSHQGLTYGNLIYNKALNSKDYLSIYKELLKFLNSKGFKVLQIKDVPYLFLKQNTNNLFLYLCFKLKAECNRVDLHSFLNLSELDLSRSRKNGVKRALKQNVVVKEEEDFTAFWNSILIPNLLNKHNVKPVHSLQEIQYLKSKFPNNIRLFCAYINNEIIAGTTIFEFQNTVHSQYISGNQLKNTTGSLDYLHWYLLEHVFKDKKYFNFGTSNENKGQHINDGLLYWKEGFNSRSIPQSFYTIKTENYKLLNDLYI